MPSITQNMNMQYVGKALTLF